MKRLLIPALLLFTIAPAMAQRNILQKLLLHHDSLFGPVLQQPDVYDVQVIYTQIDRDERNRPSFRSHTFRLDERDYYYPASTVKMPIALLALEKLNKLAIRGLDKHTAMQHGAATTPQTPVTRDTTAADGNPSVAHYVKKIFLVSDNDASNRLYEFLGQAYLNESLWNKGYANALITHRLGISGFDEMANRHTNPVSFRLNDSLLYHQGEVYSAAERSFPLRKTLRGKGYYQGEELIHQPFDFSKKNFISLQTQLDILQAVLFPESVPPSRRFQLTEDDYRLLYQVMSELPRESRYPTYDHEPDHYVKFFLFGDRTEQERMPDHIRIFNKVGWAYGFLTDIAYIIDLEAGVEFMLAATIHVNKDGIFNDDQYEYESVGLPFLANLGRVVYEHEKKRPRKFRPNLDKFNIPHYD
ncbi:MAG: hypothetical protein RLY31_1845 [Bacteroidota bacterium]|jgi:hypothetical protein